MRDKLKIALFCIHTGDLTGSAKMVIRLAKRLDGDEFSPLIITQSENTLSRAARNAGINVKVVPFAGILDTYNHGLITTSITRNAATLLRIFQYNVSVRRILKEADVIWCINARMLLTIAPSVIRSKTPVVMNVGLGLSSEGIYKWLNEFVLRIADHVFIESEIQARRLYGEQFTKYQEKFVIFHKGVDTRMFSPATIEDATHSDNETIHIGTAATLTERKGHVEAIEAIADVVDRFPEKDIRYTIAGGTSLEEDQDYKRQIEELVADLGIDDVVEFVGWIDADDMPAYYDSLDIFVLASEGEGVPGVVREALAMECAVVATDVGGTAEAVIDGETGYLVPPKDSAAIADALKELIRSPESRDRMGNAGREHIVSEFSVDAYIDNYRTFLERIVD